MKKADTTNDFKKVSLFIEAGKYTPQIDLDSEKNKLSVFGRFVNPDDNDFFIPLFEKLSVILEQLSTNEEFIIELKIQKWHDPVFKLFYQPIFDLHDKHVNKNIKIKWYHDDDDKDNPSDEQKDCALDFIDLFEIPLEIIEIKGLYKK